MTIGRKAESLRQATFVGRLDELELFRSALSASSANPLNVLMFFGIGGQGKTELLRHCHRMAQEAEIPTAFLDPQEQTGVYALLCAVHQQIKDQTKDLLRWERFEEGLKRHQAIEAKLVGHAELPRTVLQLFVRGSLSLAPGGQVVNEMLSVEHFEAAMDRILRLVGRRDGDFWMRPEEELTDRLVADLNDYAASNRLVLFLDTYEQMGAYDEWLRERVLSNLQDAALLVIAGRHRLAGKHWERFGAVMRQEELQPLRALDADEYLRRRGVTSTGLRQVLVDKADGYPLALTVLAEMAHQADEVELTSLPARQHVVPVLLKRLMQHVAKRLQSVLDVCAVLRVVNEESLAFLLGQTDARDLYEDVQQLDFVKVITGGVALHATVWEALHEDLRQRSPRRYRELNALAAQYYDEALAGQTGDDRERYVVERLYHRFQTDEAKGMALFTEQAETLVTFRLLDRLRALLDEVAHYQFQREGGALWRDYYQGRLASIEERLGDAEHLYKHVAAQADDVRLRTHALCHLGEVLARRSYLAQDSGKSARQVLRRCLDLQPDSAIAARAQYILGDLSRRLGEDHEAETYYRKALEISAGSADTYGHLLTMRRVAGWVAIRGDFSLVREYLARISSAANVAADAGPGVRADAALGINLIRLWMGKLRETREEVTELLEEMHRHEHEDLWIQERTLELLRILIYATALEGCFSEAFRYYDEYQVVTGRVVAHYETIDHALAEVKSSIHRGMGLGYYGFALLRSGDLEASQRALTESFILKQAVNDNTGLLELLVWLGFTHEVRAQSLDPAAALEELAVAETQYQQDPERGWNERRYFQCAALTALARTAYRNGDDAAAAHAFAQARQLALQYQYDDHLACLYLTQGHLAWEQRLTPQQGDYAAALQLYQQALRYALRYNRLLLDEVLWGGSSVTPLLPIVPFCMARGAEGQRMLGDIRRWWITADDGAGVPLLVAERRAREREPGDDAPQQMVVERL